MLNLKQKFEYLCLKQTLVVSSNIFNKICLREQKYLDKHRYNCYLGIIFTVQLKAQEGTLALTDSHSKPSFLNSV